MTPFAYVMLFACVPLSLIFFAILSPRRALITATIFAWLFLPNNGLLLPGLPDYTKVSATAFATILGMLIFDSGRLFPIRLRWYDLPALVICLGHVPTALSNGLPFYDGLSEALKQATMMGIPYLMGRLYLGDSEGQRDLALGIVISSLIYVPLCLYEIRFSPQLQPMLYGMSYRFEPPRYGLGFRPFVFMQSGLEVGLWMCGGALIAYWLWVSKTVREMLGVKFGLLVIVLVGVAVLCKSVGATLLMALGAAVLQLSRRTKSPIPMLVLLSLPVFYVTARPTGVWSGRQLVDESRKFDVDRAQSLEFRLDNEDMLMAKALQRPWLGWGGWGRNRVYVNGRDVSITDGLWIITMGIQGYVGLASLTLLQFLPPFLLLFRRPPKTWAEPEAAPCAAIAVLVGMYAIDNLSNAMVNPVYFLAMGGLMGLQSARPPASARERAAEDRLEARVLIEEGLVDEAEEVLVASAAAASAQLLAPVPSRDALDDLGEAHAKLADLYVATGRGEAAETCLRQAVDAWQTLSDARPGDPDPSRRLADALESLGRLLRSTGRYEEAEDAWDRSLAIRERLVRQYPGVGTLSREWADARNDLAWLLVTGAGPGGVDDASRAAEHAAAAASLDPKSHSYANTLGLALYRSGDLPGALVALRKALELSAGGTGFDHYALAMTHYRLRSFERAFDHLKRGDDWTRDQPPHPASAALRAEAYALLGGQVALPTGR